MEKRAFFLSLLILLISCLAASGEETLTPKITFSEKSFVAGEVLEGTVIEHTYRVYNKGNGVLRINRINPG
ncbi:MAG: hypothetical protein JW927_06040 [Deltaproteobacteria bacterium]|nr:hypothetical protein [Deltaproteobacteria bacterium]